MGGGLLEVKRQQTAGRSWHWARSWGHLCTPGCPPGLSSAGRKPSLGAQPCGRAGA